MQSAEEVILLSPSEYEVIAINDLRLYELELVWSNLYFISALKNVVVRSSL